jgi:hypothetical protein
VAVGVVRRITEQRRDPILELFGENVLEHLGLLVHRVPGDAQRFGEIGLEKAVVSDHLQSDLAAGFSKRSPSVGDVLHEPERPEAFQHVRGRGCGDVHPTGQGIRRHDRRARLRLDHEDRLDVVLDSG